jgi:hypothetical protein
MGQRFRIRVYGAQRKNIDPALLAQVVILYGHHLQKQRHHQQQRSHPPAGDTTLRQGPVASAHPTPRDLTESLSEDTPLPPHADTVNGDVSGEGSS